MAEFFNSVSPVNDHSSAIDIEFSGQLHNAPELCSRLHLDKAMAGQVEQLLAAGWRRWGTGLAEKLVGDYALALHDRGQRLTYLVRHPLGIKPLYYRVDHGRLSHAFSLPVLKKQVPSPLTRDLDWAAAYMLNLSSSPTRTAYKEISKLSPGHWLTCDANGRVRIEQYHHWRDDAPDTRKRDPQWVDAYREVLEEAIRCRMDASNPIGSENSGGIDSATITAYLAHFLGEPGDRLHSFGFALGELEPEYILETSQSCRIRHNYLVADRYGLAGTEDAIIAGLAAIGQPEEHVNATAHIPFYLECQQRGIKTLHSGFGGDEVVTNPGHHLRWELLDRHEYRALWDILPGDPLRRSLRLLKALTIGRKKPTYRPEFLRAWNQRWPHQLLNQQTVERLSLHQRYLDTAIYDAPYRRTNDFILEHHLTKMQILDRLENCTLVAAQHGIDYRWPLWDVRLIQQYLSTPSIEKLGPKGIGRYLHRRAIDGVVPKKVAWKPSKDMGYGLFQQRNLTRLQHEAEQAKQLEAELHPDLQPLIDRGKLRQQIRQAGQGEVPTELGFQFRNNIRHLAALNHWLTDSP